MWTSSIKRSIRSLFGLALAIAASHANAAQIDLGCVADELQVARPLGNTQVQLDPIALEKWVTAHPERHQGSARFLQRNLKYVSQFEFEDALYEGMDRHRAKHPNVPVMVVHLDYYGKGRKSGRWVAALLQERYPDAGLQIAGIPKEVGRISSFLKDFPKGRVLLVDDASYSGSDLETSLELLTGDLEGSIPRTDVLIPFLSTRSLEIAKENGVPKQRLFHTRHMPSIEELAQKLPKSMKTQVLAQVTVKNESNVPLHVFEHRVPDGVSFPSAMATGWVHGRKNRIRFLRFSRPIYHLTPNQRSKLKAPPVPRPDGDSRARLNRKALAKWVQAQSPKLRDGAQYLADHIQFIKQTDFERTLFETAEKYLSQIPPGKVILVHRDAQQKGQRSGRWVAALISERFPEKRLRIMSILPTQSARREVSGDSALYQAMTRDPEIRLLWVDDAVYSGIEMETSFNSISAALGNSPEMKRRADALVAYSSNAGKSALKEQKGWGNFYFGQSLMTLDDRLEAEPPARAKKLREQIKRILNGRLERPTTLFEHKVPDSASFPFELLIGSTPGGHGQVKFIHSAKPIYKERYVAPGEVR